MPPILTSHKTISDLLRYEVDPQFCREGGKIANETAATVVYPAATHPVKAGTVAGTYQVVLSGDEAAATAFILHTRPETIAANTIGQRSYSVLARGPAVLTSAGMMTADYAGTAYVAGALKTAAEALPSVLVRDEVGLTIEPLNPTGM